MEVPDDDEGASESSALAGPLALQKERYHDQKFNYKEKKWLPIPEYPLSDNLDSWACAMCYVP